MPGSTATKAVATTSLATMTRPNVSPVAAALAAVVRQMGVSVGSDPHRARASLTDAMAAGARGYRAEIDALVIAAEESIPAAMAVPGFDRSAAMQRLRDRGLSDDIAEFAIEAWHRSLGVATVGMAPLPTWTAPGEFAGATTPPDPPQSGAYRMVVSGNGPLGSGQPPPPVPLADPHVSVGQPVESSWSAGKLTALVLGVVAVLVVIPLVIGVAVVLTRDSTDPTSVTASSTAAMATSSVLPAAQGCPPTDGSAARATVFTSPFPDACTDPTTSYMARFVTTQGAFTVALAPQVAPKTVNNFVSLARWKFYDGLTFHRVVQDFVSQGGDPGGDGSGGPGYTFADELPLLDAYVAGSLAMANAGPDTNGSQFFIIPNDIGASSLRDPGRGEALYSLFGQVTDGMDVVTRINMVETDPATEKPITPVTITSVTITEG